MGVKGKNLNAFPLRPLATSGGAHKNSSRAFEAPLGEGAAARLKRLGTPGFQKTAVNTGRPSMWRWKDQDSRGHLVCTAAKSRRNSLSSGNKAIELPLVLVQDLPGASLPCRLQPDHDALWEIIGRGVRDGKRSFPAFHGTLPSSALAKSSNSRAPA